MFLRIAGASFLSASVWLIGCAATAPAPTLIIQQGGVLVNGELHTQRETIEDSLRALKAKNIRLCITSDAPHSTVYDIQDMLHELKVEFEIFDGC
jgi:hypothetical protein